MTTLTDSNTTTTQNIPIDEEAAIFLKDIFTETTNSVDKLRKFSDFIRAVESCVDDPNKARNNFGSTFLKSNPNLTHQKLKILS